MQANICYCLCLFVSVVYHVYLFMFHIIVSDWSLTSSSTLPTLMSPSLSTSTTLPRCPTLMSPRFSRVTTPGNQNSELAPSQKLWMIEKHLLITTQVYSRLKISNSWDQLGHIKHSFAVLATCKHVHPIFTAKYRSRRKNRKMSTKKKRSLGIPHSFASMQLAIFQLTWHQYAIQGHFCPATVSLSKGWLSSFQLGFLLLRPTHQKKTVGKCFPTSKTWMKINLCAAKHACRNLLPGDATWFTSTAPPAVSAPLPTLPVLDPPPLPAEISISKFKVWRIKLGITKKRKMSGGDHDT